MFNNIIVFDYFSVCLLLPNRFARSGITLLVKQENALRGNGRVTLGCQKQNNVANCGCSGPHFGASAVSRPSAITRGNGVHPKNAKATRMVAPCTPERNKWAMHYLSVTPDWFRWIRLLFLPDQTFLQAIPTSRSYYTSKPCLIHTSKASTYHNTQS